MINNNKVMAATLMAIYMVPVSSYADTSIFHSRARGGEYDGYTNTGCATDSFTVNVSESGYRDTGNVATDNFKGNFIDITITHFDACTFSGWMLSGSSNTGTVTVTGGEAYGKAMTAKATGIVPLTGFNFPSFTAINDTATINFSLAGVIASAAKSTFRAEYPVGTGTFRVDQTNDDNEGLVSSATVSVSTANLGQLNPASSSARVYNAISRDMTITTKRPAPIP